MGDARVQLSETEKILYYPASCHSQHFKPCMLCWAVALEWDKQAATCTSAHQKQNAVSQLPQMFSPYLWRCICDVRCIYSIISARMDTFPHSSEHTIILWPAITIFMIECVVGSCVGHYKWLQNLVNYFTHACTEPSYKLPFCLSVSIK